MIELIMNRRGMVLGYRIEGVFFSKSFIDSIVSQDLGYNKITLGTRSGNKVRINEEFYKLNTDYLSCLRGLGISLNLNDISFVERPPSEDELYELSSIWGTKDLVNKNRYTIIDNNLNILGYLATSTSSPNCYICMIEILNKGRGIGSRVVMELSKRYSISGYSCVSAKDFWLKCGAKFENQYRFNIDRNM